MAATHLMPTAVVEPHRDAVAMYAAFPDLAMCDEPAPPVEWSTELEGRLLAQFADQSSNWSPVAHVDRVWATPTVHRRFRLFGRPLKPGQSAYYLRGNCNDFDPYLLRRYRAVGIARGAMRLTTCVIKSKWQADAPHLVLAVETTAGSFICCNIRGCHLLDSPIWRNQHLRYDWHAWEGHRRTNDWPGGAWESLRRVGLVEAIERAKS